MSAELVTNTKNAFDYIQKLYSEVALLIQEAESHLQAEPERFVIGLPSGYGVVARGSSGLDAAYVRLWPTRKFSIFFVPESGTEVKGGQTITSLTQPVIYVRFLLDGYSVTKTNGDPLKEPAVLYGVFTKIERKHQKRFEKVEQLLIHLEYYEDRVFANLPMVVYEDAVVRAHGVFEHVPLFELRDASDVVQKLVQPAVQLYRQQTAPIASAAS
jgi:hypothetical protein